MRMAKRRYLLWDKFGGASDHINSNRSRRLLPNNLNRCHSNLCLLAILMISQVRDSGATQETAHRMPLRRRATVRGLRWRLTPLPRHLFRRRSHPRMMACSTPLNHRHISLLRLTLIGSRRPNRYSNRRGETLNIWGSRPWQPNKLLLVRGRHSLRRCTCDC